MPRISRTSRHQGVLTLTRLRDPTEAEPRHIVITSQSDAQNTVTGSAGECDLLILHLNQASNRDLISPFRQCVNCHHYLRWTPARSRRVQPTAWELSRLPLVLQSRIAPRDTWIGWGVHPRKYNLLRSPVAEPPRLGKQFYPKFPRIFRSPM